MGKPPIDPPLTPEEIAESRRIASEYFKMVTDALVGAPKPARRSKKWRRNNKPLAASERGHEYNHLPTMAMNLTLFCKRGACRRAGRCCFGQRRGDAAGVPNLHGAAPCFARLPDVVQYVLPYAVGRRFEPEHFRDEFSLRCEKSWIDAARRKIAEAAAAREAQGEAAANGQWEGTAGVGWSEAPDATSDAAAQGHTAFPAPPPPRPRLTQL